MREFFKKATSKIDGTGCGRSERESRSTRERVSDRLAGVPPRARARLSSLSLARVATLALVAMLLVSSVAGPLATTATASSVPAGMVTIPDSNVSENLGANASVNVSASDFRGSVMTTDHAESLEVIVTSADRVTGPNATRLGSSDEIALIVRDDVESDGRKVAIPADAIRKSLGYLPKRIQGVNSETGETWSTSVATSGGLLIFDVPHFSSNAITFTSEVRLTGEPASTGATFEYQVADLDAVSDFNITLTGSTVTERDSDSGRVTSSGTVDVPVAGTAPPTSQEVTLSGVETTSSGTWSGSASGGSTSSITVGGNVAPRNTEITFTGSRDETSRTVSESFASNGATTSYSVGGNVAPEDEQVTFYGETSSSNGDQNFGTVSAGGSESISNPGNIEPTGPSNGEPTVTVSPVSGPKIHPWDSDDNGLIGRGNQSFEFTFRDKGTGYIDNFRVYNEYTPDSQIYYDVYVVEESADGTVGEGTKVGDNVPLFGNGWSGTQIDHSVGSAPVTIELVYVSGPTSDFQINLPTHSSAENNLWSSESGFESSYGRAELETAPQANVDITDGGSADFGVVTGQETQAVNIPQGSTSLSVSGKGSVDVSIDKTDRTATQNPAVDVDGDGSAEASYSGILTSGETVTRSVQLSRGSSTAETTLSAGTVSWDLDYTEVTVAKNPGVDVNSDGVDEATVSGRLDQGESATRTISTLPSGGVTLDWSQTAGPSFGWELTTSEVTHTEDPSVDVDGDGVGDVSYSGILGPGETASTSTDKLTLTTSSVDVETSSSSAVDVTVSYDERTQTESPTVEINGNTTSFAGTLSDGETVNVSTSTSWVREGTNRVNVTVSETVSTDAPAGQVDLVYRHDALDEQTVDYTGEAWSERYQVEKTFAESRPNATLTVPFAGDVVGIRGVETRTNSSTWSDVDASDWEFDGTTLTVDLGSVDAGEKVELNVTGSKVRVGNGEIQVVEPTAPGQSVDTQFRVESRQPGFHIRVDGTTSSPFTHYLINESWNSPADYAEIRASGEQRVYLPGSSNGSTARVTTLPLVVEPESGQALVGVEQAGAEPRLDVRPGTTVGDSVSYEWHNTVSGEKYELYSTSSDVVRDQETAESPVTLVDDDSDETLIIRESTTNSSSGSTSSENGGNIVPPISTTGGDRLPLLLAGAGAVILGAALVLRRFTDDPVYQVGGTASVAIVVVVIAGESIAPGVLLGPIGENVGRVVPLLALGFGGLAVYYLYVRFIRGRQPRPIEIVTRRGD